jgi:hypothetical protein
LEYGNNIANLKNLLIIEIDENKFTGNLPNLNGLAIQIFEAYDNQFEGSVPLYNCSSLQYLDFRNNSLSGDFPIEYMNPNKYASLIYIGITQNYDINMDRVPECQRIPFCFKSNTLIRCHQL